MPLPGFERTRSLSINEPIIEKPSPALSPVSQVVKSGYIAFFTSAMPQPRSLMLIDTRAPSNIFACM